MDHRPDPEPGGKGLNAESFLSGVSGSASAALAVGSFKVVGLNGVTATLTVRWDGHVGSGSAAQVPVVTPQAR